jgi:hypothetical protein
MRHVSLGNSVRSRRDFGVAAMEVFRRYIQSLHSICEMFWPLEKGDTHNSTVNPRFASKIAVLRIYSKWMPVL